MIKKRALDTLSTRLGLHPKQVALYIYSLVSQYALSELGE